MPEDTSSRIIARAKSATDGDHAQSARVNAARVEPAVITVAAPTLSICLPMNGAERPPMNRETEKTAKTRSRLMPRSLAIPGARMLKA
ncbi:hypothetical protein D9M72_628680 [compost metagenome]